MSYVDMFLPFGDFSKIEKTNYSTWQVLAVDYDYLHIL